MVMEAHIDISYVRYYCIYHGLCQISDYGLYIIYIYAESKDGDIRIVGGSTVNEGRVEVYHNSKWGTVCDNLWNTTDANVVCRQLGYSGATSAPGLATFGEGSGPTHYDGVSCTGNEARLADCPRRDTGIADCTHSEDAGVVCRIPGEFSIVYKACTRIRIHKRMSICLFVLLNKLSFTGFIRH